MLELMAVRSSIYKLNMQNQADVKLLADMMREVVAFPEVLGIPVQKEKEEAGRGIPVVGIAEGLP